MKNKTKYESMSCPGMSGFSCEECNSCSDLPETKIPETQSVVSALIATEPLEKPQQYNESMPIEFKPKVVFQVNFDDGEKWVIVAPTDVTLEIAVESLIGSYPERSFRVGQIEIGAFKLAEKYVPEGEAVYRSGFPWVTSDRDVEF